MDYGTQQAPPRFRAPSPSAVQGRVSRPLAVGTLVASLLVVLGCVLPWATVDLGFVTASYSGYQADGRLFIWAGVLSAVIALLELGGRGSRGLSVAAVIMLAIAGIGSAVDLGNVQRVIDNYKMGSVVHAGGGLVLTVVAGIGGAVIAGLGERTRRNSAVL